MKSHKVLPVVLVLFLVAVFLFSLKYSELSGAFSALQEDECPDDPNKTEPGICGCGTPDDDTDGDGTPDCIDECPDVPYGIDEGCGCGNPPPGICGDCSGDPDSDGDGTPDCMDICPGSDDSQDTDGDGMPDGCDSCPNDPSNTDSDSDGICDTDDVCPNNWENDADGDGICEDTDNCQSVYNPGQEDYNDDGMGNFCDGECRGIDDLCQCGDSVTADATLSADLDCTSFGNGLIIGESEVTLDCAEHKIIGDNNGFGVKLNGYSASTIKNCEISGFTQGILSDSAEGTSILSNNIHDNSQYNIAVRRAVNYIITDNIVSNSDVGIRVVASSGCEVYNNIVTDHTGSLGYGISLGASSGSSENSIYDNTIESNKIGIHSVNSVDNTFENNNINNNCEGMNLVSSTVSLTNNDFVNNNPALFDFCGNAGGGDTGLYVDSSSQAEITDGSFVDNGMFGVKAESGSIVNWYVGTGATCTDNALYFGEEADYSIDESVSRTSCPILPDEEGEISCDQEVTEDLTLTGPLICDGEYSNGLVVGADDITIDCDGWGLSGTGSGSGIYLSEYSGVTIQGCDITGFNYGVEINPGRDVTISNNNLYNNNNNGLYAYASDGLQILGNNIRNNYYSGIYIDGSEDELSNHVITGNIVNGNANGCSSGCGGIELNYEDNCLIQDNEVSHNGYNGISLYESNNNQILDNSISDNYNINLRLAASDSEVGGSNIISQNTISDGCIGIRVATENNTITDNTIEGDGTFNCDYWGSNYGIFLGYGHVTADNNYFEGNDISGYYYGVYAGGINSFIMNEDVHDNNYGVYLENIGGSETAPTVSNSNIYDNCEGARIASGSTVNIIDTDFSGNNPDELEACAEDEEETTGLYVDGSSKVNLVNGNFEDNGEYGINDGGPRTVEWTLTDDVSCTNNDVYIYDGFIVPFGGSIAADNCRIYLWDEELSDWKELNLPAGEQGRVNMDIDTSGDNNDSVGSRDVGVEMEIHTTTDSTGAVKVTFYNSNPGGSGFSLSSMNVWVTVNVTGDIINNLNYWILKIYYTDEQVAAAGLDENTLRVEYYNDTSGTWTIFDSPDGGVNTEENYVWARLTHFSIFGVFGSSPPAVSTGGGGRGPSSKVCNSYWVCGKWGECINNTQIRTCRDVNECFPSRIEGEFCNVTITEPVVEAEEIVEEPTTTAELEEIPAVPEEKATNLTAFIVVFSALAVIAAGLFGGSTYYKKQQRLKPHLISLREAISKNIKKGHSPEKIKEAVLEKGWSREIADREMEKALMNFKEYN